MLVMNKDKIFNLLLIVSSFIVYLEWGTDQKMFLVQMEYEIILKSLSHPTSILHPFIILPFIGQIILIITLFQNKPSKKLTYFALAGLGVLIVFIFFIGLIGVKLKIIFFSLPFMTLMMFRFYQLRKK